LLNQVDCSGKPIAPDVLSIAQEIGPRAVAYAETLIGDPAFAVSCLEEAAAAVSAVIVEKERTGGPAIRDIRAYLFRAFIRMIDKAKRKQVSLEDSLGRNAGCEFALWQEGREEIRVLLNEVMAVCGQVSGRIIMLHLEGWSWDEIGNQFGISRHAAETRYRKALDRARKKLRIRE